MEDDSADYIRGGDRDAVRTLTLHRCKSSLLRPASSACSRASGEHDWLEEGEAECPSKRGRVGAIMLSTSFARLHKMYRPDHGFVIMNRCPDKDNTRASIGHSSEWA